MRTSISPAVLIGGLLASWAMAPSMLAQDEGETRAQDEIPEVPVDAAEPADPVVAPQARIELGVVVEPDSAESLLDALETADADLQRLSSNVVYQRFSELQGDLQTRLGTLYYESDTRPSTGAASAAPRRAFAVAFRQLVVDRSVRAIHRDYVFDGEWLVEREIDADGKRFTKRRIARPGATFDPFRVGSQALIPLPIGQRKDEMLARYEAELLEPYEELGEVPSDDPLFGLDNTHQLRLRPIAVEAGGEGDDRFSEIRLWYERGTLMPMATLAVHRNGDESVIRLAGTRRNDEAATFEVSTAVPRDPGWEVRVEE